MQLTGPMPTLTVAILQILISMVAEDFLFYWIHRLMHHRLLYKYIHKQHHRYKNTVRFGPPFTRTANLFA